MLERAAAGANSSLPHGDVERRLVRQGVERVRRHRRPGVLGVHAHTVSSFFRSRRSLLQTAAERYGDSSLP